MRLALVSLLAFAGLAPMALAQAPAPMTPPADAATPPPPPVPPPAPEAAPAAPAATPAPVPAPASEAPPPPPAPPAAPTDPAAIALQSVLETVCIPAANGGDLAKLAKAAGYHKSGDNYVYHQASFQFTILAPGANPTQCHVDLVHPVYPQAPAAPLVVALHNWAAVSRGWTLYRNDKNVDGGQEFTTRSWEHSADGKNEALVLTTIRRPDGSPMHGNTDTSMMIYSVTKG